MLILTRNRNQRVMIGDDIVVTVVDVKGGQVRVGIQAPKEMEVDREEVYLRKQAERETR